MKKIINCFRFFLKRNETILGEEIRVEESKEDISSAKESSSKEDKKDTPNRNIKKLALLKKYNDANFFITSTQIDVYKKEKVVQRGSVIDHAVLFNKCRKLVKKYNLKEDFKTYDPYSPSDYLGHIGSFYFLPTIKSYFKEKYGKVSEGFNFRKSVRRGLLSKEQEKNLRYHENFIGIIPLKFLMVMPEGSELVALVSRYKPNHVGSKSFVFNTKKFFGKTNKKFYTLHGDWEKDGVVFLDHRGLSTNQMFVVKDAIVGQATVITKYYCRTMPEKKVPSMLKEILKEITFTPVVGSGEKNATYVDVIQVALAHGWTFPKISELHPNAYNLCNAYGVAGNRITSIHKFFSPVNSIQDIKKMGGYKFALGCYVAAYKQMQGAQKSLKNLRVEKITPLRFFEGNEDSGVIVVDEENNFTHGGIIYNVYYSSITPATSFISAERAIAQKAELEKDLGEKLKIFRRRTTVCKDVGPRSYEWRYDILHVEKFSKQISVEWIPEPGLKPDYRYSLAEREREELYWDGLPFLEEGWMEAPTSFDSINQTVRGALGGKRVRWDGSVFSHYPYKMVLVKNSKIVAGAKYIING